MTVTFIKYETFKICMPTVRVWTNALFMFSRTKLLRTFIIIMIEFVTNVHIDTEIQHTTSYKTNRTFVTGISSRTFVQIDISSHIIIYRNLVSVRQVDPEKNSCTTKQNAYRVTCKRNIAILIEPIFAN